MNNLEFRKFNVGDLLVQELSSPPDIRVIKRGVIVEISNNISTIEWLSDSQNSKLRTTSIQNLSLRRMIMAGYMQHYPVIKEEV
jgi:hypothetical protein